MPTLLLETVTGNSHWLLLSWGRDPDKAANCDCCLEVLLDYDAWSGVWRLASGVDALLAYGTDDEACSL
jgi:hypothetical protein